VCAGPNLIDELTMNLPRTLIIDLSVGYGGSSSRALGLLRGLSNEGVALAGLDRGAVVLAARREGLPVYSLGSHKADPRIAVHLVRLIRVGGFQVLDTQNIQSKFWGSLGASISRVALVSTLNSWYEDEHGQSFKGFLYKLIEQATNRSLDLYIAVSKIIRDQLLEHGVPVAAVELIQNAVAINETTIRNDPVWLRQAHHLPESVLVCCAVGRLVPAKGYEDLIDAFAEIALGQAEIYCLIVGDGPLNETLKQRIASKGLENRVLLLGTRNHDEALSIMRSSTIFVMPSRSEGTPIALLEAGALGRPILATRAGGIPDLVLQDKHALLVNVGDIAGLAKALQLLASDPALRDRLATEAQMHIRQSFSLTAQLEATREAYLKAWRRSRQRLRVGNDE